MTQQPILKLPLTYEPVMGRIIDADGHNVCMVYSSIQTNEVARARFIVQAVNAHEDLLATLRLLLEQEYNTAGECGWCFQSPFGHCERATCPGVIARAAIAKATGATP